MRSLTTELPESNRISKDTIVIVATGVLCAICISVLIASAFTAHLDADAADTQEDSDSPITAKIFTAGWMFLLSFKLRRELVGLVGNSSMLQPW